jgi:hypothetical protein
MGWRFCTRPVITHAVIAASNVVGTAVFFAPSIFEAIGRYTGSAGSILISLIGGGISIRGAIELGFLRGTVGQNSYGPDPL